MAQHTEMREYEPHFQGPSPQTTQPAQCGAWEERWKCHVGYHSGGTL